jgi:hypothetical protein
MQRKKKPASKKSTSKKPTSKKPTSKTAGKTKPKSSSKAAGATKSKSATSKSSAKTRRAPRRGSVPKRSKARSSPQLVRNRTSRARDPSSNGVASAKVATTSVLASAAHVDEFAPCRLVDHGAGRFSLCLDDFGMPDNVDELFDERGLQGGGYTWQGVAESLVRMRAPGLEVKYDSEAGMFVALGSREALRTVAGLLREAMRDPALMREALDRADPDRLE